MKKILLATTILGMSAGVAAADISWSASAAAGLASNYGDDYATYSMMKVGIKGSAETDSGLTFSATTDMKIGRSFDRAGDLGDDGFDDEDATFGMPTISIGGAFGTISFADDDMDLHDDEASGGDVKYVGTFGAVTAGVIYDVDNNVGSAQLSYSANGLAVSADYTNDPVHGYDSSWEIINASAAYTMGSLTGTLSTRYSEHDDEQVTKLKLAYSADAISASIKVGDDDSYDLSVGYTANGLSVTAETDEDELTTVYGSYDLGGGLSIEAGADSDESAYVGATMKF